MKRKDNACGYRVFCSLELKDLKEDCDKTHGLRIGTDGFVELEFTLETAQIVNKQTAKGMSRTYKANRVVPYAAS